MEGSSSAVTASGHTRFLSVLRNMIRLADDNYSVWVDERGRVTEVSYFGAHTPSSEKVASLIERALGPTPPVSIGTWSKLVDDDDCGWSASVTVSK